MNDIKQRVEEAILDLVQTDGEDCYWFYKDDLNHLTEKLIKDLTLREEKLVECVKFYADENVTDHCDDEIKNEYRDGFANFGDFARDTLKDLGINPTNGDV